MSSNIWLIIAVIVFVVGQLYLFGKLLGWGDLIDKFFRR